MKNLRAFLYLLFAFVFMFISWTAVSAADEVVIGYTGPLTGPAAEYGQDCVNGIDMAVKEINAAGGITVKGKKYSFFSRKLRLQSR